jgi:cytochrome P450
VGPKALPRLREQIDKVSEEVLHAIASRKIVTAKNLAETYTVAILARLFLNHPGTLKDFQAIGSAISRVTEYFFLKKWGKPSDVQCKQYAADLQTLRNAIAQSSGEFIDSLKKGGLSSVQIKGELLLVYVAGSETTASSLQYILWRLGQDHKLQEDMWNNPDAALKFVEDCMLRYTPVTLFARFARKDLVISVQNKDGKIWKYPIAKGEGLIMAPHLSKYSIFGGGKHSCPGQWLARTEMVSLISTLIARYEITSSPKKKELATLPGLGFLKVEPVNLALRKRGLVS